MPQDDLLMLDIYDFMKFANIVPLIFALLMPHIGRVNELYDLTIVLVG